MPRTAVPGTLADLRSRSRAGLQLESVSIPSPAKAHERRGRGPDRHRPTGAPRAAVVRPDRSGHNTQRPYRPDGPRPRGPGRLDARLARANHRQPAPHLEEVNHMTDAITSSGTVFGASGTTTRSTGSTRAARWGGHVPQAPDGPDDASGPDAADRLGPDAQPARTVRERRGHQQAQQADHRAQPRPGLRRFRGDDRQDRHVARREGAPTPASSTASSPDPRARCS